MGLVCTLVVTPIVRLIHVIVAIAERVLVAICRVVDELVNVLTQVLKWLCNTVVRTVCGTVCGLVCGICDFFCGIFGCDCGCRNVCKNVCDTVSDVVCGWTYVAEWVLQWVKKLVCDYIFRFIIRLLHLIEAIVTMVLTWVCTLIDLLIRWFLCWTYLAELPDRLLGSKRQRRFKVAPRVIRNAAGHSGWFVYVANPDAAGTVDQTAITYILSDEGRPLIPRVARGGGVTYEEVMTEGDRITGRVRRDDFDRPVTGRPFLYYPHKVMEIASHLFGDIFASSGTDDGAGTDFSENLFTYQTGVQAWLEVDKTLARNNYNLWSGKYTNPASQDYFGDQSIADMGLRVDNDATCSRPTNTFLHLVSGVGFTPTNTGIAEEMSCGASQSLTFDETNFLMIHKDADPNAVTTYFVSQYEHNESAVGCNDLLGYTTVGALDNNGSPLFMTNRVLAYSADTNRMMARIVQNVSGNAARITRVAETYLHECGHQSGLLHNEDLPDCRDDTTLHITNLMDPGASVRRAFTRLQWCLVRTTWYVTSANVTPWTQAPELPDSGTRPGGPIP